MLNIKGTEQAGPLTTRQRVIHQLQRRRQFATVRSWAADGYVRVLNWLPGTPLPGHGCDYTIHPRGLARPVLVRANTTDIACMEEIFLTDEYAMVRNFVADPVANILDLGGNVGYSVRYWQEDFPAASILVVEPDEGNLRQLARNVALGPAPENVRTRRAFAAATVGVARLDRHLGEYAIRMEAKSDGDGPMVEKISVGKLVEMAGAAIDLLKCDIEGTEAEVFAQCQAWIGSVRALVVETHPPYSADQLLKDLKANGCEMMRTSIVRKGGGLELLWASLGKAAPPQGSAEARP